MSGKYRKRLLFAALLIVLILLSFKLFGQKDRQVFATDVEAGELLDFKPSTGSIPYAMLPGTQGEKDGALPTIEIDAARYVSASRDAQVAVKTDADGQEALYWNNDEGWVEWRVNVPTAGAYQLEFDYSPLPGSYANIVRGLQIDGETPFAEAESLVLERYWKDAKFPYDRNEIGQEIRPVQQEIEGWKTTAAANYAVSSLPFRFKLSQGVHTIRLVAEKEPVVIRKLRWMPQPDIPDYVEYKRKHPDTANAGKSWYQVIEAERYEQKSNAAIQTMPVSEPNISPDPKGRIVYNTLGGDRWRNPGDWVEWTAEVPADGWYVLDLKFYQGYRGDFKAFRTFMIDGEVPFREMLHYAFPPNGGFEIDSVKDSTGAPYRFFLTKGKHTLRMIADASPLHPALLALQDVLAELGALDQSVRMMMGNYGSGSGATAQNLDTLRTWNLTKYDPGLSGKIEKQIERLRQIAAYLDGINQSKTDITDAIDVAIDMLRHMADNVNGIPNRLTDFSTMQNNIGTWLSQLDNQPLLLDYIVARTPETATGLKAPTSLSRIPYSLVNFARTFYMDYDTRKLNRKGALTVWIQRGRDYAEELRQLIESDFTPRTGIRVNVNLMPNPNQLILGNAAGDRPDVVLGAGTEMPVDYAMRGAIADLSTFPEFLEVVRRFHPGAMRSFAYDGGTYALPEVQNFLVLYYRTDIFERLKLKVPDTWDDVYNMLPTLQENGMTMFVPPKDFVPFFYQNGVEFYAPNGKADNLGSDGALAAFRQWTELYTKYYLPLDAPAFFNHFRNGDIPTGIADFNTYLQLQVAAPEITGHWKIAPVPGIRQADGQVARWTAQGVSGAMIMKKSDKQQDAWEFLKWWTSDDVQTRYGNDMESFYGLEYRWNTANLKAMSSLSWPAGDFRTIREQTRWVKNMPYVPGYYLLGREMDFAWNAVVVEGKPPKESLEKASVALQREMQRRQADFDISGRDDLRVPQVDQPLDWGDVER
ncbi:extracellular solute-binding protein [Cohnella sp. REN36]|uniref:extracellular solute-binding protein n=1 Tax=Cohnella sp. REN36 TaxID=2887347 RepID=UPI001D14D818|nr:extracellular solute-binding protein [Cohnella sp. REN36]MCC3371873.1 extracellular solute-binding protein [Cohnella sp. REN36]